MTDVLCVNYLPDDVATAEEAEALNAENESDVLTAAAEVHTGAMVALVPSAEDAARLAVDGGEEPEQLHLTVCYLGEAALIPSEVRAELIDRIIECASRMPTIIAKAFAVSAFNPVTAGAGGAPEPCVTLTLTGGLLEKAHEGLAYDTYTTLDKYGVDYPAPHRPWIPHITLLYTNDADISYFTDRIGPVTFDTVRVAFGGDIYDIPLGESGEVTAAFDPNQPRDEDGQWVDGDFDFDDDFSDEDEDEDEAEDITPNMFDNLQPNWSDAQRNALKRYVGTNHEKINMHLRGELPDVEPVIRERIETLRGMMRPTDKPTRAVRGVSINNLGDGDITHENIASKLSDSILRHRGFTSTSLSRQVVEDNFSSSLLFDIDVPVGTPAVWVGGEEHELLLDTNTRFEVQSIERAGKYQTIVHVKVIV